MCVCVCVYEDMQCSISFLPKSHTYPKSTFTLSPSGYPPLLVLAYPSRVLSCIKDKWKNILHFLLSLYKRQHFTSFFILCYLLNLSVLVQIEHPGSFYSCIVVLCMEIPLLMNQSSAMDPEWFLIFNYYKQAMVNKLMHTSFCTCTSTSLWQIHRSEIAGSKSICNFKFWWPVQNIPLQKSYQSTFPLAMDEAASLHMASPTDWTFIHLMHWKNIFQCTFNVYFSYFE